MNRAISATPLALAQVGHHERARAAHSLGVALHDIERGAHIRREIDLVDHQEIGAGDAGPALGRDLIAGCDIDDVDREIGKLRRERRRQIVAAGLDQDQVELGELAPHVGDGGEVDRGVLADRGVRAAAGLDTGDALRRKRAGADQVLSVPLGVDVVGDGGDLIAFAQMLAQRIHQRGLARPDRAADADTQGTMWAFHRGHDRNNLVYWVSWRMLAISARKVAPPTSSSGVAVAACTAAATTGSSSASTR